METFGRVMAATYVLEEQYSETACFVDLSFFAPFSRH